MSETTTYVGHGFRPGRCASMPSQKQRAPVRKQTLPRRTSHTNDAQARTPVCAGTAAHHARADRFKTLRYQQHASPYRTACPPSKAYFDRYRRKQHVRAPRTSVGRGTSLTTLGGGGEIVPLPLLYQYSAGMHAPANKTGTICSGSRHF